MNLCDPARLMSVGRLTLSILVIRLNTMFGVNQNSAHSHKNIIAVCASKQQALDEGRG